jgi:hypothetical protein
MQILTIKFDPKTNFCLLEFPYSRRFADFLKMGVTPLSYRKFDPIIKKWSVHVSKIPLVVKFGRRFFVHVDYSSLPEDIQIRLVQLLLNDDYRSELRSGPASSVAAKTPHQVLYLLPTAPPEVVKASYRVLAGLHHPDHGGSPEDFRAIQEAYEELMGKS